MNAIVKRLGDGRVADTYGEVWSPPAKHAMTLTEIVVCDYCKGDVMTARTVLGGFMRLDSDGNQHACRARRDLRAWHR